VEGAIAASPAIRSAINVHRGVLVHPAVAAAFGLPCRPLAS
jgi:alanine dehydrogenase